jgi:glycogen(starch) synthase
MSRNKKPFGQRPDGAITVHQTRSGSLNVLHLGFEDPLMPGAGGGSVRTHEINRRIVAGGHQVTVLTTRYPGSAERTQDGVHYVPIGFGQGNNRLSRLLGYVIRLPLAVRRRPDAELVVEDFFAPFSTMAAPMWTNRPTVGMVQWLHARDKAREYRLPFHLLERAGVRRHRQLIAVSQGTADQLSAMNPAARVSVIGNGVDQAAFLTTPQLGRNIVFIGRLELHGKGVDLLLAAWARASRHIDGQLVIAGTGSDESRIRKMVDDMNLSTRVRFAGWVQGAAKYDLLSSARLVVVPSRHETFGLVAVEALASGTPVVAFDIPCLSEVVPAGSGWLVPRFDVELFSSELIKRYADADELLAAGLRGRTFAANFDWDRLADLQIDQYRDALDQSDAQLEPTGSGAGRPLPPAVERAGIA